jgi:hypothetical protein
MPSKKPNLESAVVTARVLSRLMRKAGFVMANTRNSRSWTEGFHVHRVGCGNFVSIGYSDGPRSLKTDGHAARRREAWQKLEAFLVERGYVRSGESAGWWIECERAD